MFKELTSVLFLSFVSEISFEKMQRNAFEKLVRGASVLPLILSGL